jgi:hypothetical protein
MLRVLSLNALSRQRSYPTFGSVREKFHVHTVLIEILHFEKSKGTTDFQVLCFYAKNLKLFNFFNYLKNFLLKKNRWTQKPLFRV